MQGVGVVKISASMTHFIRDTCPLISLILANGAARHLPAHLPDTRQVSRATPARSSA